MPSRASPKSSPPIPLSVIGNLPSNTDAAVDLGFLQDWQHNTYVPNGWGFTVYRAVFGPCSNERFAAGVKRLEDWLHFSVRQNRYDLFGKRTALPSDPDTDLTNLVAERLWNELVEDYPDKDKIKLSTTPDDEGSEDFTPIGTAFVRWAEQLGVDLSRRNARYNHCLILDDAALKSLEGLPNEVPKVKPRPAGTPEGRDLTRIKQGAWVWVLDRETIQARQAGTFRRSPEDIYPPWIRIRLPFLQTLWFYPPQGLAPEEWWQVSEEDRVKHDRVFWWNERATTMNQVLRNHRSQMEMMRQVV